MKLYWAHSDYSLAEVEEYIELDTGWSDADEVSKEISRRKIREIGELAPVANDNLNNGMPVKTKIGFSVNEGQGLNLVAYNDGSTTLTGAQLVFATGHCWIRPS